MTTARDDILGRVRRATASATAPSVGRDYRQSAPADIELLADRLVDYRATVLRCLPNEVASAVESALSGVGVRRVIVPDGLASQFHPSHLPVHVDNGTASATALDRDDLAAVTTCAVAIAETGTLVLDGSEGQGRRLLTLVPDHHVCVVPVDRVVATVPEAVARLDPLRPLTWISGPSATSDIELRRVEGVHGPRHLIVVLVDDR